MSLFYYPNLFWNQIKKLKGSNVQNIIMKDITNLMGLGTLLSIVKSSGCLMCV